MAANGTRLELTLRGRVLAWLAALAAGAAWLGGDANARLAAALLATPLLVDLLAKQRHLGALRIRVAPRRTPASAPFLETLLVEHAGPRPLREFLLHEPRTMRLQHAVLLPTLPAGRTVHFAVRQRSLHRGVARERVFLLASHWPLGMFLVRATVHTEVELVTEPARVALSVDAELAAAVGPTLPSDRARLAGTEFHSLREHDLNEDVRGVHALRSAALGVMVRRVTHGWSPRVVGMVVDLRQAPGRLLPSRRFEHGLSAAATLLRLLRHRGITVHALVLGTGNTLVLVQNPAREGELMTLLAAAEPAAFRAVTAATLAPLANLDHCFLVTTGGNTKDVAALRGGIVTVGGDDA